MIHVLQIAFEPSYAMLVTMALLAVVVILQMRRMRSSRMQMLKLQRRINELQCENEKLTQALAAQREVVEPSGVIIAEQMATNAEEESVDAVVESDEALAQEAIDDAILAGESGEQSEKLTGSDEDLLNRFVEHINKNMSDINLSIDDIASDMCMSRSNLFRKIKQITGIGPNEYMRLARLKRAAELLQERRHSIADICMLVGFNSPSYFSSCFKKQYGCLPKDYK
ncbi:MAG: helix-turn-helix transcriptional regulator [Alistipes sp.]|nr:helix-turn-helix transcriptional regulator [Alistipes sp.]